ncbi:DUF1643 domain-containing protein [Blastococcus sp. LR1]|uniref:DUF1643 domain-containing protein n=1 Tax=Blastococcus sp. LR1 TaxID=2877000 RepID=UPI001CCBBE43|nr:DUF1643 domain-containing protein [Blastococcus sp. LR1]MCA0143347.1 DUF1643 domain-containing protein [Blastococcus sp. LR1]
MTDPFASLAGEHGLEDRPGTSPDGLPERYLYSPDMVFRYAFGRWWGEADLASTVVWVLLNPATGDTEKRRRPTLDRCIGRSREMGASGLLIVNLFAVRHTDPKMIRSVDDPVGPAGDDALRVFTAAGQATVAAWGSHGSWRGRSAEVGSLLDDPLCLGTTASGEPRHPLYVRADAPLGPWRPPTG